MADIIGKSIEQYHILEPLGQGGMATVYKAFDTRVERDVAIKLIRTDEFPPSQLERLLQRFEREAKAMARLQHPNIISIINYGTWQGTPYLVMPYISGGTLKERIGNAMDWQQAVKLILPISDALGYAHTKGLIHRDVKPSNILISETGEPLLTDFGIAKIVEQEEGQPTLTGTGVGVGTPEYMAPEQGLGRKVDGRADIYALGIVLFEVLTGSKPYTADTPLAVLLKQVNDPLPKISDYSTQVPEGLERVLYKALAKQPENRYVDMAEFRRGLEQIYEEDKKIHIVPQKARPVPVDGGETRDALEVLPSPVLKPAYFKEKPEPFIKRSLDPVQSEIKPVKKKRYPVWILVSGVGVIGLIFLVSQLGGRNIATSPALNSQPTEQSTQSPTKTSTEIHTATPGTKEPLVSTKVTQSGTEETLLTATPLESDLLPAQEIFPGESKFISWLGSIGVIADFSQPSDLFIRCLTCDEVTEQQVTFTGDYYTPSWSPDGTMITAIRLDVDTWSKKLVIMNSNGTWEKELKANDPMFGYSSWSPNGREIAYGTEDGELWVINIFTNETYRIISREQIETDYDLREISWSPDGNSLLFLTEETSKIEFEYQSCGSIWIVKPDGSDLKRFDSPSEYCIISAAWSAFQKGQIAFSWVSSISEDQEDLIMNEDTLSYQRLNEATIIYSSLYYPQYIYCGPGYYECSTTIKSIH